MLGEQAWGAVFLKFIPKFFCINLVKMVTLSLLVPEKGNRNAAIKTSFKIVCFHICGHSLGSAHIWIRCPQAFGTLL